MLFDPDEQHAHVRECGVEQYRLCLEVRDVLECGAVSMPVEEDADGCGGWGGGRDRCRDDGVAFFLQLHVRTLDGRRFCFPEDTAHAWCVVFWMRSRNELYEVARAVLDALDAVREEAPLAVSDRPGQSLTSIPFPCLDCVSELEAASQMRTRAETLREERSPTSAQGVPSRSLQTSTSLAATPGPPEIVLRPGDANRTLLTMQLAECLYEHIPATLRIPGVVEWVLQYTPKAHGVSLATFYRNVAGCERTLVLVRDNEDHVFGGFAPEPWEPGQRFYGNGEAFVFSFGCIDTSLRVDNALKLRIYPWNGKDCFFMYSDHESVAMGGGSGGHAFSVRADLLRGSSVPTQTFGSPTLASAAEFAIRDFEVWAFQDVIRPWS